MTLRFLCPKHFQSLMAEPAQAKQYWQQWIETGSRHYEEGQYRDAISFLGCAYEIAGQLLSCSWPTAAVISRFTYSSICLARAYEQIGEVETSRYLKADANSRLEALCVVDANSDSDHIVRCQKSLYAYADSCYWVNHQLLEDVYQDYLNPTNYAQTVH